MHIFSYFFCQSRPFTKIGRFFIALFGGLLILLAACGKKESAPLPPPPPEALLLRAASVQGISGTNEFFVNTLRPAIALQFSASLDRSTVGTAISLTNAAGVVVPVHTTYSRNDSTLELQPQAALADLERFTLRLGRNLLSSNKGALSAERTFSITTGIDSTPKFPAISDDSLLTLIQKQTFRYFWDFGHPVSGMARERNSSGELVTTGGTGFGIMGMIAAVQRGFITRQQALERVGTISLFLEQKAIRYKGAFAHWLNGTTGATIPFSANDNGADLVETSFLMMGLLTARQYFDGTDPAEVALRNRITALYNGVEWNWFRRNNENVLYWHWSPDKEWAISLRIQGWNECLVTYVLAAGSPTHSIPQATYTEGWTRSGGMRNGNTYYGVQLPLGPNLGGPLFFAHYSFLGINPKGLADNFTNYYDQNRAHSLVNFNYCSNNPQNKRGYSTHCWGLTASDIPGGYTASSPTNDRGVIAPTAAVASLPFTPVESMRAIRFFYYTLGHRLWKEYGFIDAFSIHDLWFASSFLAIDQGPQIVMIENHRSGLLWNLFSACPEVKAGLKKLGFTAPYLE